MGLAEVLDAGVPARSAAALKIAVLSDWEDSGGANIAARRLMEGFETAGHHIVRLYQQANLTNARFETHLIPSRFGTHQMSWLARMATRATPRDLNQRLHERQSEATLDQLLTRIRPDVINVHNLHMARWSPEMIRVCARHAPVVCKLCDTWTFTGRCYNPGTCQRFLTTCNEECPTATEYPALAPDRIRAAFERRRSVFEECENVAAVAPSQWMGRLATAGLWKHRPVFHIANGIHLDRYRPIDRYVARASLGLSDPAKRVLLCTAAILDEKKKGVHFALEALTRGVPEPLTLLLLGRPQDVPTIPHVDIHCLGYVSDDDHKATIYSAADLYVHPSLADNSPNTVIESLACGTPVVAFPVDGVPEMVIAGRTGWLAETASAESLHNTFLTALADLRVGVDLRESSRAFARSRFDMPAVIRQYERVFARMRVGQPIEPGLQVA